MVRIISRNYNDYKYILLNLFNLKYINGHQSNRSEGDFDFGRISDQSKEESKSQHIQSSEDLVETFSIKELKAIRTDNKIVINMKKIREVRKCESYKKKVSIIDVSPETIRQSSMKKTRMEKRKSKELIDK